MTKIAPMNMNCQRPAHAERPRRFAPVLLCILSCAGLWPCDLSAQSSAGNYTFSTLAGGRQGYVDAKGSAAEFHAPEGIAVDRKGNLYVTEYRNHTIRKIAPDGTVTTIAGRHDTSGSTDGPGPEARFLHTHGLAVGEDLTVYMCDYGNHTIRKISPSGEVTTVAGKASQAGATDGPGAEARFFKPEGVAVATDGTLYVADTYNFTVRKISKNGDVRTLAGKAGTPGDADGPGSASRFNMPLGVALDGAGNLYVADANFDQKPTGNCTVRKISPEGNVTTLAGKAGVPGGADGKGTNSRFTRSVGIAVTRNGTVYVADTGAHTIRRISPEGEVTTLGGTFQVGGNADGAASTARFLTPQSIAVDEAGTLYIADTMNHRIRKGGPVGAR